MRILTFSDINWSGRTWSTNLNELIGLVERTQPNLVLLAGDLVDDDKGTISDTRFLWWQNLSEFLDFLERNRVRCCFVKGNWDDRPEYDKLVKQTYTHVEEISEKMVEVNNVRVLGISNAFTNKLSTMKKIRSLCPETVDIVLTHADGRRRIWLFELPARLIITGHFDQQFCLVRNTVFLSFDHFPGQYALVDYQRADMQIRFYNAIGNTTRTFVQVNGHSSWLPPQDTAWSQYGQQMEALLTLKEQVDKLNPRGKREAIDKLLELGVFKTHILDYIPGANAFL